MKKGAPRPDDRACKFPPKAIKIANRFGEDGQIGTGRRAYDSSPQQGFAMNLSEEEQSDHRFPNHPLSRPRRLLNHFQGTLRVSEDLKSKPPFLWRFAMAGERANALGRAAGHWVILRAPPI